MTIHHVAVVAKDGASATITGGVRQHDNSGAGTGPNVPEIVLVDSTGAEIVGTTADAKNAATDTTAISAMSVLKQISASVQSTATNSGSALAAGTNVIGKVGIDQTSDGTTNAVRLLAETTKVIGTVNISASQSLSLAAATSGGLSRSRTIIPNNTTAIVVKASAGQVYGIRATNNSANIAYVKLYDATSATAGVGTPVDTLMIPAASAGGAGVLDKSDIGWPHATGITYIVTTGIADNDTTAPAASAYIVTVSYK